MQTQDKNCTSQHRAIPFCLWTCDHAGTIPWGWQRMHVVPCVAWVPCGALEKVPGGVTSRLHFRCAACVLGRCGEAGLIMPRLSPVGVDVEPSRRKLVCNLLLSTPSGVQLGSTSEAGPVILSAVDSSLRVRRLISLALDLSLSLLLSLWHGPSTWSPKATLFPSKSPLCLPETWGLTKRPAGSKVHG